MQLSQQQTNAMRNAPELNNMGSLTRINRELKYKAAILDVYNDTIEFENGNREEWDYVAHRKGAAAILPVLPDGRIVLVRQYRNSIERETIEIPAGAKDYIGEPSVECALRELEEETGYRSENVEYLYTIATTVAFCNEVVEIFLARDLIPSVQKLDENEFINVEVYELDELVTMILNGVIQDGKTVGAILAYKAKYIKS